MLLAALMVFMAGIAPIASAQMTEQRAQRATPDSTARSYSQLEVSLSLSTEDAIEHIRGILAVEGLKVTKQDDDTIVAEPLNRTYFAPGTIELVVSPIGENHSLVVLTGYTLAYDEQRIGVLPVHHNPERVVLTNGSSHLERTANQITWSGMMRLAALIATVRVR